MRPILTLVLIAQALTVTLPRGALAGEAPAREWVEGTHYVRLDPLQPTTVPAGKVEVMEVFSYGCPACNRFQAVMEQLRTSLPPNAQLVFLPASFNAGENWPMLQRAFLTARALGVAERAHQAMYDAVWKTGELASIDPDTHRPKNPRPSIGDAARVYARVTGVDAATFVSTADSFVVEMQMSAADAQIAAMQVPGTPCLIVNGRYRVINDSVANAAELIEVVKYLVTHEGR